MIADRSVRPARSTRRCRPFRRIRRGPSLGTVSPMQARHITTLILSAGAIFGGCAMNETPEVNEVPQVEVVDTSLAPLGPNQCLPLHTKCGGSPLCCSGACSADTRTCCVPFGNACTSASDCCSGPCTNGLCKPAPPPPPPPACVTFGGACATNGACCWGECKQNVCACTTSGQACNERMDCCSGVCKANGTCQ